LSERLKSEFSRVFVRLEIAQAFFVDDSFNPVTFSIKKSTCIVLAKPVTRNDSKKRNFCEVKTFLAFHVNFKKRSTLPTSFHRWFFAKTITFFLRKRLKFYAYMTQLIISTI